MPYDPAATWVSGTIPFDVSKSDADVCTRSAGAPHVEQGTGVVAFSKLAHRLKDPARFALVIVRTQAFLPSVEQG